MSGEGKSPEIRDVRRCNTCGLTKAQARGVKCVIGRTTYSQHSWPGKYVCQQCKRRAYVLYDGWCYACMAKNCERDA